MAKTAILDKSKQHRLRQALGGGLRPNDPRRFLIEAMVGAMHADGVVDQRELETLRRTLRTHEFFADLPADAASMLIELATDAISFAGGAATRIGVIARSLPARTHRLAAYAMACEVCAADEDIADSELRFLTGLRVAFNLSHRDHDDLVAAASRGHAMAMLETKAEKIHGFLPLIVEGFVLRRLSIGPLENQHCKEIEDFLVALPDFSAVPEQISKELEGACRSKQDRNEFEPRLQRLGRLFSHHNDRYWMMVYMLVFEMSRGIESWRDAPFVLRLQQSFRLSATEMSMVESNARLFAAAQV